MLTDDLARVLRNATQYAGVTGSPSGDVRVATLYADDLAPPPRRAAAQPSQAGSRWIQDVKHPWVVIKWPNDLPIPGGWLALSSFSSVPPPPRGGPPPAGQVSYVSELSVSFALVRHAAEAAYAEAARRSLREFLQEQRRLAALEVLGPQVTPGGAGRYPPRPSRIPRAPRAPRPPRFARRPRRPRTNGTKNVNPRPKPCRRRNSLGQCISKDCVASAVIPDPGVGHSSCNWGPVDSCGNCVTQGCEGPASFLLKPFLRLLPKYWTEQSVTLVQQERQAVKQAKRGQIQWGRLPERTPGAQTTGYTTVTVDPRALSSGCYCQDWPGWAICPRCSGSPKCRCQGACIAFPANSGNC